MAGKSQKPISGYMIDPQDLGNYQEVFAWLDKNGAAGYTRNRKSDYDLLSTQASGKFAFECYQENLCEGNKRIDYVYQAYYLLVDDAMRRANYLCEVLGLEDGESEGLVTSKAAAIKVELEKVSSQVMYVFKKSKKLTGSS